MIKIFEEKFKSKMDKMKLKNEVLIHKGMVAEIMARVDWDENELTTEEKIRLDELISNIKLAEKVLENC